jgi:hypothetical protein
MTWPEPGEPLPRSREAYVPPEKWSWILGRDGHGAHWRRVFGDVDAELLWEAFTALAITSPISRVRDLGQLGRTSEVRMRLALKNRTANVITVWHYDSVDSAPRLVTAYPTT